MTTVRPRRLLVACVAVALLAAACGSSGDGDRGDGSNDAPTIQAAFASYDVSTGREQRVMVGLFTGDSRNVAFGTAALAFEGPGGETFTSAASFIPVPGTEDLGGGARLVRPSEGSGVYGARATFPTPGPWTVTATVTLQGVETSAETAFVVLATHQVPAPGDPAPATRNAIAGDDVAPHAIDSRAIDDQPIPDPELHADRIDELLAAGRPMLVVVSTPVYCVSQFCGPITDEVAALAGEFGDRLAFVHLEVWADFEDQVVNDAAADWIFPRDGGGAREPWVFLVDGQGVIVERWDNVASRAELRAGIEALLDR